MKNGPWHCDFPMEPGGGYQCGGPKAWLSFRCIVCGHQEALFGTVRTEPDGLTTWVPAPRRVLTTLMCKTTEGVLARGICEDETIFQNLLFPSFSKAIEELARHYKNRGFRLVFNIPKELS